MYVATYGKGINYIAILLLLFQLLEILCNNPTNARTVSCSSFNATIGYERDTCSFTCNTGYELTGSDTRTCQSDGSWSGSDDVCRRGIYSNDCAVTNDHILLCYSD